MLCRGRNRLDDFRNKAGLDGLCGQMLRFAPNEGADCVLVLGGMRCGCRAHCRIFIRRAQELADRDMNRAVMQASDFPLSVSGDMFSSLYRLFQAVRAESTMLIRMLDKRHFSSPFWRFCHRPLDQLNTRRSGLVRRDKIFVIHSEHAFVFLEGFAHTGESLMWRCHFRHCLWISAWAALDANGVFESGPLMPVI